MALPRLKVIDINSRCVYGWLGPTCSQQSNITCYQSLHYPRRMLLLATAQTPAYKHRTAQNCALHLILSTYTLHTCGQCRGKAGGRSELIKLIRKKAAHLTSLFCIDKCAEECTDRISLRSIDFWISPEMALTRHINGKLSSAIVLLDNVL